MGEPHRHHYIPSLYLKHWAGEDNTICEYTKFPHKIMLRHKGPDSTGYQEHLYTFRDLRPEIAAAIETALLKPSDDKASKALDKLIFGVHGPWTLEMRRDWARFLFGLKLRHPDSVPELREGVKQSWQNSRRQSEEEYQRIKTKDHPPTFDEYIFQQDASYLTRVQMHLFAGAFDSDRIGTHIVNMVWDVMDLRWASNELLTSDWPVELAFHRGIVSLPISPTKLFIATNTRPMLESILQQNPSEIVKTINIALVSQARRHVWSRDDRQRRFIENRMSTQMVAKPFYPTLGDV